MGDFYVPYYKKDLISFIVAHYPDIKPYVWGQKSREQLVAIYIKIMHRLQKGTYGK
jgi:hypothetical protein